jgi:hypothetical protein
VSLAEVTTCFETIPDTTCAGSDASVQTVPAGYLTGLALVEYETVASGAQFAPANQLPIGATLFCKMSDGSICPGAVGAAVSGEYQVPPSSMTFGVATPFQPAFDFSQLSSVTMGQAFVAGFLLVAAAFVIGKPIGLLVGMIRS